MSDPDPDEDTDPDAAPIEDVTIGTDGKLQIVSKPPAHTPRLGLKAMSDWLFALRSRMTFSEPSLAQQKDALIEAGKIEAALALGRVADRTIMVFEAEDYETIRQIEATIDWLALQREIEKGKKR